MPGIIPRVPEGGDDIERSTAVLQVDGAERGLDQSLRLAEGATGDSGQIEYLGELFRELLDEMDFAV